MANAEIETLLARIIGLQVSSIGQASLDRAIARRMRFLALDTREEYLHRLRSSKEEVKELIEEVVVPETWFLRDEKPFAALAHFAREWPDQPAADVVRILSIPCSTGEEPYSIAITLAQAGCPRHRYHIDAVDISSRALARARRAVYGDYSFRGENVGFREHFFDLTPEGWVPKSLIRKEVHFRQGNLLDSRFIEPLGTYQIIFCRNLLIYLDLSARKKAFAALDHLLAPEGVLFVGHAEAGLLCGSGFKNIGYPQAFAFQRQEADTTTILDRCRPPSGLPSSSPASGHPKATGQTTVPPGHTNVSSLPIPLAPPAPRAPTMSGATPMGSPPDLHRAQQLADQGELEEAAKICAAIIERDGPSAPAYFLLGVIRDAAGDPGAATGLLRKAIYLEPNYLEALILLALICERQGDKAGAQAYRRRAERIEARTGGQKSRAILSGERM